MLISIISAVLSIMYLFCAIMYFVEGQVVMGIIWLIGAAVWVVLTIFNYLYRDK